MTQNTNDDVNSSSYINIITRIHTRFYCILCGESFINHSRMSEPLLRTITETSVLPSFFEVVLLDQLEDTTISSVHHVISTFTRSLAIRRTRLSSLNTTTSSSPSRNQPLSPLSTSSSTTTSTLRFSLSSLLSSLHRTYNTNVNTIIDNIIAYSSDNADLLSFIVVLVIQHNSLILNDKTLAESLYGLRRTRHVIKPGIIVSSSSSSSM